MVQTPISLSITASTVDLMSSSLIQNPKSKINLFLLISLALISVFGCSAEKLEPLSWDLRIQIAIDVARALEYLLDGAIEAVSDLKTYLAARFSLKEGMN